ncbi:MAG TPA: argininosuccinate synthase [bacterium]|nr:argininosuccinate synthase [bacterium]HOL48237.1 argininosuccinate synthase [bacterium]HPQ18141.1 argininosuccinate synthase [bacterium]
MEIKRIVLAYSGGLDTSVMIKWLIENYKCEVIAFSADLGQGEYLEPLRERAIKTGAKEIVIEDLKEEFVKDFIFPALKANVKYEKKYPLATALGRPLISKKLVEVARKYKADAVAHGSTGKGNDQVRFEVSVMALAPDLKVLAPVREWELKTREEEIEYAAKHKIPIDVTKKKPYSIDINLWGVSIECGVLENPEIEPPSDIYLWTKSIDEAPDKPEYIEIEFEKGEPVALNNQKMNCVDLITELNKIGGRHSIGRVDMIENRLVGIKSREIYECPAAEILYCAHHELEAMCLDRETYHFKHTIETRYSELVYYGWWYSPLREALDAFINKTQEYVSGKIKIKLYKGNIIIASRQSKNSLYVQKLATYDKGDIFDQKLAKGFVQLWGLPLKVVGQRKINNER